MATQTRNEGWPRSVRLCWALRFVDDFALIYPVYLVLFLRSGLSLVEVSLMLSIWCGTVVVTEVPTGALADRVDRRTLIVVAMLCKAMGFGCWLMADGFWLFTAGFIFWGLQESLMSGTVQSLLWDVLERRGRSEQYATVAARAGFYSRLGTALALIAGGFIATYNMRLVLLGSVAMMLVGAGLACGLRDVRQPSVETTHSGYFASIWEAGRQVLHQPPLQRIVVFAMIGLVWGDTDEFDQAYRELVGLPLFAFGLWNVGLMGCQAAAAHFADRLSGNGRGPLKFAMVAIAGLTLLVAALFPSLAMLPVYAVSLVVGAASEVLVDAEVQRAIQAEHRATITSLNSLLMNLSSIAAMLLVGGLSSIGGLPLGFAAVAVVVLVYAGLGWIWEQSARPSEPTQ